MNRFDRFTTEELMLIKWALFLLIVAYDNEDKAICNENKYKIVKSLYESIKEYLKEKKND